MIKRTAFIFAMGLYSANNFAQSNFIRDEFSGWSNLDANYPVYFDPSPFYANGEMLCHDGRSLGIQSDSRFMGPDTWAPFDVRSFSSIRAAARCWRMPGRCDSRVWNSGNSLQACTSMGASNLSAQTFNALDSRGSILNGTNLSGSRLNSMDFTGTYFMSTNLSGAQINNSALWGTRFHNVVATGLTMRDSWISFDSGFFSAALNNRGVATSSASVGGDFRSANFLNNRATHLRLSGTSLEGAKFQTYPDYYGRSATSSTLLIRESAIPSNLEIGGYLDNRADSYSSFAYLGLVNTGSRQNVNSSNELYITLAYNDFMTLNCVQTRKNGRVNPVSAYVRNGGFLKLEACANRNSATMGNWRGDEALEAYVSGDFPLGAVVKGRRLDLDLRGFMPAVTFSSTNSSSPILVEDSGMSGYFPFFQAPKVIGGYMYIWGAYIPGISLRGNFSYSNFSQGIHNAALQGDFRYSTFRATNSERLHMGPVEMFGDFSGAVFENVEISGRNSHFAPVMRDAWFINSRISSDVHFYRISVWGDEEPYEPENLRGIILAGNSSLPLTREQMIARGVRKCLRYHTEVETLPSQLTLVHPNSGVRRSMEVPNSLRNRTRYVCDEFEF